MNSSGLGLVRLLIAPSRIAFQTESGNAIAAMPACRKLDQIRREPSQTR
jgi:hypothetical protein